MHYRLLPMPKIFRSVSVLVAVVALLFAAEGGAQVKGERDDPSVALPCPECGVIYEVREIKRERESARSLPQDTGSRNLPQDTAAMGPMIRFTLGDKADRQPHVDVVGSRKMRDAMMYSYYEVVVRFDDNRWQRIELPDATGLKAGDRIRVHQNRIEPDDSETR